MVISIQIEIGEKEALIKCRGVLIIEMISPPTPFGLRQSFVIFHSECATHMGGYARGGAFNIWARRAHRMVYRTIGTVCCVIMLMIFE